MKIFILKKENSSYYIYILNKRSYNLIQIRQIANI